MSDEGKLFPSRVFVRVRPFTKEEASIPPADCPIAREVIHWDKGRCLTVLDHLNHFKPRKNGKFRLDSVLWSFTDEEVPEIRPVLQEEVYRRVVKPVLSQIVEGYSTAFLVAGAASSGRLYTLYGNSQEGPERGLLFRFADDIFCEIEKRKEPESVITCEMEAIDMVGDSSFIDCFAPGGGTGGSSGFSKKSRGGMGTPLNAGGAPVELKLTSTPEGTKLQGATTINIPDAKALKSQLGKLFATVSKRSTTHTISLKFTETFDFEDPNSAANGGSASIQRSRRFCVLFVLLRNLPAAFARCLQVAVEHDTGEAPMAAVPVRETALTRLYPDLLRQGFALNFVSCVSPFFEHSKDTISTLNFSTKVMQLLGKPKKQEDERLPELRHLMEEVKHLKTEVRKQNDAMEVVQQELNAREIELIKQEGANAKAKENLDLAKEDLRLAVIGRNYQVDKSRRARKKMQKILDFEKKAIHALQKEIDEYEKANEDSLSYVKKIHANCEEILRRVEKENTATAEYRSMLSSLEEEDERVKKLEEFNELPKEEQKKIIRQELEGHESEDTDLASVMAALKAQIAEVEGEYAKVVSKEREVELSSVGGLKEEIAALDVDIATLEGRIMMTKSSKQTEGCCLAM